MKKYLLIALLAFLPFCAFSQTNNEGYRLEFEDAFIFGFDTTTSTSVTYTKSFKIPANTVLKIVSGQGTQATGFSMEIDGVPMPYMMNPSMEIPTWLPGGKTVTIICRTTSGYPSVFRLSGILYRKVPN